MTLEAYPGLTPAPDLRSYQVLESSLFIHANCSQKADDSVIQSAFMGNFTAIR